MHTSVVTSARAGADRNQKRKQGKGYEKLCDSNRGTGAAPNSYMRTKNTDESHSTRSLRNSGSILTPHENEQSNQENNGGHWNSPRGALLDSHKDTRYKDASLALPPSSFKKAAEISAGLGLLIGTILVGVALEYTGTLIGATTGGIAAFLICAGIFFLYLSKTRNATTLDQTKILSSSHEGQVEDNKPTLKVTSQEADQESASSQNEPTPNLKLGSTQIERHSPTEEVRSL